jgi:hydrogenase maturation protease
LDNIAIIGIGNILLKDDGIGVHTINELKKENLGSTVTLIDGGTSTFDMLPYFTDYKNIIIIDALRSELTPGTIYKILPSDLLNYKKENLSLHDVQIFDILKIANLMGSTPDVVIYGVEPYDLSEGLGISDTIKTIIPNLIELIKNEISVPKER